MKKRIIEPIAYITTPFKDKFGIPRQSGMIDSITAEIRFVPKYRNAEAVRGLSEFSHIWVLWEFSGFDSESWSPTVRPPRLGGNKRMGVFATRSPNRPNSIGLSSLRLIDIVLNKEDSPILIVSGADILDGTAIYDIKPYIPFSDSHPTATFGFASEYRDYKLDVSFARELALDMSDTEWKSSIEILSLDPRPSYQTDPQRIYGLTIFNHNIKFRVDNDTITVIEAKNEM